MPLAAAPTGASSTPRSAASPFRVLSLAIDAASGRLDEIGSAPLPASSCWISTDRQRPLPALGVVRLEPGRGQPDRRRRRRRRGAAGRRDRGQRALDPGRSAQSLRFRGLPRRRRRAADALRRRERRLGDNDPPAWRGARRRRAAPLRLPSDAAVRLPAQRARRHRSTCSASTARRGTLRARLGRRRAAARLRRRRAVGRRPAPDARRPLPLRQRASLEHARVVRRRRRRAARSTPLATTPTEAEPRGFAITPDGRFLIAVGQASHRLSRYAIDARAASSACSASQPVGSQSELGRDRRAAALSTVGAPERDRIALAGLRRARRRDGHRPLRVHADPADDAARRRRRPARGELARERELPRLPRRRAAAARFEPLAAPPPRRPHAGRRPGAGPPRPRRHRRCSRWRWRCRWPAAWPTLRFAAGVASALVLRVLVGLVPGAARGARRARARRRDVRRAGRRHRRQRPARRARWSRGSGTRAPAWIVFGAARRRC